MCYASVRYWCVILQPHYKPRQNVYIFLVSDLRSGLIKAYTFTLRAQQSLAADKLHQHFAETQTSPLTFMDVQPSHSGTFNRL